MKKETFDLMIRLIAGVAASLILVGCIAILGDKMDDGRTGPLYQASGMRLSDTMMTIDGQAVSVEEYLYYVGYGCDMVSAMGVTDLDMEIGEGMTAADYVAQQAVGTVTNRAVVEAWAAEVGITMTDEEVAEMNAQLDQVMMEMDLSRRFLEEQMRYQYLSNHIVEEYSIPGGKLYPAADAIQAGMEQAQSHGHEHDEATVVVELCNEEFAQRCNDAEVVYNEKYNGKLNVKEFYQKFAAIATAQ